MYITLHYQYKSYLPCDPMTFQLEPNLEGFVLVCDHRNPHIVSLVIKGE